MQDCTYPCPCGYYQDTVKECTCSNSVITRFQFFSLLKLHLWTDARPQSTAHSMRFIEVPRFDYEKLSDNPLGEPSLTIQARVEAAHEIQRARFGETELACNADMSGKEHR